MLQINWHLFYKDQILWEIYMTREVQYNIDQTISMHKQK